MTPLFRSAALWSFCLSALGAFDAMAQQPAPAPATAVQVPAMECPNPGSPPLDKAGSDMTRFSKRVDDYKVCVNKYASSAGAKSNEFAEQSRAYADAANKAIDDYNGYVTRLNDSTKSTKSGADKN